MPPPEIVVESVAGLNLTNGASADFGCVAVGTNGTRTCILRNFGGTNLTGLAAHVDGAHSGDFVVIAPGETNLAPYATSTWVVTFTPATTGLRTAQLHFTSNDPDENPFDITLSGTGLTALEAWRLCHFGSITNDGIAADAYDAELDGTLQIVKVTLPACAGPRRFVRIRVTAP